MVVHDAPKLATGGANPQVFVESIEDTVALAGADLRRDFEHGFPEAWRRIQLRRNFMKDTLRIDLPPEVLPFSNIPRGFRLSC